MKLYKHKDGFWHLDFTLNGKRCRPSTGCTSKRDATKVMVEIIGRVKSGTYDPKPKRATTFPRPMEIVVESYLQDRERRGRRMDSYRKLDDWVKVFKGRDVTSVTLEDVEQRLERWMDERSWSPATYNGALSGLSGVLSYAYRKGWIDKHPLKGRAERMPANNARQRYLRKQELEAILQAAEDVAREKTPEAPETWLSDLITASVSTGLRRGVLCNIRMADVEEDEQGGLWLFVGKEKNGDPVHKPLYGDLRAIVERRMSEAVGEAYLFPAHTGGTSYYVYATYLKLAVERVAAEHPDWGLTWGASRDGVTVHSLRHTMASLAANNGVPLDVVQKMGNWRTPSMMRRYAHLSDERLQDGEAKLATILTWRNPDKGARSREMREELSA